MLRIFFKSFFSIFKPKSGNNINEQSPSIVLNQLVGRQKEELLVSVRLGQDWIGVSPLNDCLREPLESRFVLCVIIIVDIVCPSICLLAQSFWVNSRKKGFNPESRICSCVCAKQQNHGLQEEIQPTYDTYKRLQYPNRANRQAALQRFQNSPDITDRQVEQKIVNTFSCNNCSVIVSCLNQFQGLDSRHGCLSFEITYRLKTASNKPYNISLTQGLEQIETKGKSGKTSRTTFAYKNKNLNVIYFSGYTVVVCLSF